MDRRVVLPAPEGPIIARVDPGVAYPVLFSTSTFPPIDADRFCQTSVISLLIGIF